MRLNSKPAKTPVNLLLVDNDDTANVGDAVVFSGYPLTTPGMVTHRGMVSGFDSSRSVIFVQGPVNKGNSGGALLNAQGRIVGIISMREGGISEALEELIVRIDQGASQIRTQIVGVDTLQATKAIIQTLDQHISTGIGYARSVKFLRVYTDKNQNLLK